VSDACRMCGDAVAFGSEYFTAAAEGKIYYKIRDDTLHLHIPGSWPTTSA
jgi:hypothetical protein